MIVPGAVLCYTAHAYKTHVHITGESEVVMSEVELQQVGSYTITGLLSVSSTSTFYLSKHRKKVVVIKRLNIPLHTHEAKEAFVVRARQLKKLKDRNIVNVLDVNFDGDYGYLVMEHITGESLRQHIVAGSRLAPDEVRRYLAPIASALHYAHLNKTVHGNLHPGNLLLAPHNDTLLTEFSLTPPDFTPSLDDDAFAVPYMSPEHLRGEQASAASDQYALAVMAYEWLCGRRPYEATERELLLEQQQTPFPAPSSLNKSISPLVEAVLTRALAYNPQERFPHTHALAEHYLHALMGTPIKTVEAPVRSQAKPVPPTPSSVASNGNGHHALTIPNGQTIQNTQGVQQVPEANQTKQSTKAASTISTDSAISLAANIVDLPPALDEPQTDRQVQEQNAGAAQSASTNTTSLLNTTPRVSRVRDAQKDYDEGDAPDEASASSQTDEQETTTEVPTIAPSPGESRLNALINQDLRQGGVLSRSLPGYEERLAQIEMATVVAQSLNKNMPAIVEAGTGTGKALDVDTPIPTPSGWKRMGDLIPGDAVFDEQGQPTRVIAAFDVMHQRPCYEVVFSDGSSLIADAEHEWVSYTCADRKRTSRPYTDTYTAKNFVTSQQLALLDHLIALSQEEDILSADLTVALIGGHRWSVLQATRKMTPINPGTRPQRYQGKPLLTAVRDRLAKDLHEQRRDNRTYTLVTTEKMAATLTIGSSRRANHAIVVADALVLPDADLPIAPYFLGVWLGDGNCRNNQITTADPDLIPEIEKDGYTIRPLQSNTYRYAVDDENGKATNRWQSGMTGRLRTLGLLQNKHIPAIYLRASEQQRRALLAGLLDTDGTINRCGAAEFTTTNPQLAQDVYELVCSLGFRATLREGRARLKGKDCGPKWTLAFTTDQQVFRLKRKVITHKERLHNFTPERNRFRYVVAIREVPSRPVRCIQVESPNHLYLAGRSMIPTHNSLAYLVPTIRSGKVAIVSTANKALQEQLYYKDIPFIQKHIKPFEAALVKGVSNYICLDRVEGERTGMQFYTKNRDFSRLLDAINDADENFMGDFETLGFQLPSDIRSRIATDSDQCAWSKCGFFADCYVRQMRERAERAQVIVVNHTLLLLDAAIGGFLLPERDVIILDEAHHLEEEATRSFTITISPTQIQTLLAQRLLKDHSQVNLQDEATRIAQEMWMQLALVANPGFKGRSNLEAPLEIGLRLAGIISDLTDSLRRHRPKDMPEKETQLYDKLLKRTQNLAEGIRTVFSVSEPDKFVYYVERIEGSAARGFVLQASAAPLNVTTWLKERLFNKCNVICTSATLATVGPNAAKPGDKGPNFSYFRSRVGLEPQTTPNVLERVLPLTFDYETHALLYLPRDLPEPTYGAGSDDYMKAIAREMYKLVKLSHGRAFLLFSSKRMLDRAYELMSPHLPYPLLKQGDMTRIELTRRFREEEGSVLFGLKSFWEGVDIAGDALSLVVIDKLPFDPPDDPVHEARVAHMKAAGENWFGTYVLPQAVLRLKQGIGRLLRTRDDRGVMAILDTRLHTKGYGKQVLNALPPARRTNSLRDVERFFSFPD